MHAIVVRHRARRVILDDEGLVQRIMGGLMSFCAAVGGVSCVALLLVQ